MTEPLELRPYQEAAVEAFLAAGHGTIKAAPGSGKTVIAIAAVKAVVARDGFVRVLVVTPTVDLVRQWEGFFERFGFGPAEYKVVTYALAARHAERVEFFEGFDFIVADEMHHLAEGPAFMQILLPIHEARYALGLSATPPTDPENAALRVLPVVYEYTLEESQEQGYAAPVEVRPVPVALTDAERARYTELTDLIRTAVTRAGSVGKAAKRPAAVDPMTGETIYGGQLMTIRKQLVAMAENKFRKLDELVYDILGLSSCCAPDHQCAVPDRIFVWSEYIDALLEAKATLNRNGYIAELVTGQTPKKERRRLLTEAWGRDFPVLLIAKIGEEGLDYPEVAHGVIIAGAKTSRQNIQRIGRLLRPRPGKVAKLWLIFCERTMEERLIDLVDAVT